MNPLPAILLNLKICLKTGLNFMKSEVRKIKSISRYYWLSHERVNLFYAILSDLFVISLVGYLFFLWLDRAYNQCISNYFSLNIILVIVLISGILTAILAKGSSQKIK